MEKISNSFINRDKKKDNFAEKKLTQAEISKNVEENERQAAKEQNNHQAAFR